MRTIRALACAASLAGLISSAATPVLASDLLFRAEQGEAIMSNFDGRPFWEIQAFCAGFHGASANYFDQRGDSDRARAHEASGVAALNDAVAQLRRDRGLTTEGATKLAEGAVVVGGRNTAQELRADGIGAHGRWNYWRSFCIDANSAYRMAAR